MSDADRDIAKLRQCALRWEMLRRRITEGMPEVRRDTKPWTPESWEELVNYLDSQITVDPFGMPAADALTRQAAEIERLKGGLKFYADGEHFNRNDPHAWDTVSGEPDNFYCDEADTATVEDGTIAARVLAGWAMPPDDDEMMIPPARAALSEAPKETKA